MLIVYTEELNVGMLSLISDTLIVTIASVDLGVLPKSVALTVKLKVSMASLSISPLTVIVPLMAAMENRPSSLPPTME